MAESDSSEEGDLACFFRRHAEGSSGDSGDEASATSGHHAVAAADTAPLLPPSPNLTQLCLPGAPKPITLVEEKSKGIGFQLWPAAEFLCR
jgi:hypothetical protein